MDEILPHEITLISAEMKWGPVPDISEEADVSAWRAEHAGLLAKGPQAVLDEAAALDASFARQCEAE